jgi:flagellar biogenesis protein FliO
MPLACYSLLLLAAAAGQGDAGTGHRPPGFGSGNQRATTESFARSAAGGHATPPAAGGLRLASPDGPATGSARDLVRPSRELAPPTEKRQLPRPAASGERPAGDPAAALATTGTSLAVVLGLFLIVAWIIRRQSPRAMAPLPPEVLELLGRAELPGKQPLYLARCGRKLLLVAVSSAGVQTLTEITDPDEVTRLAGICQQNQPGSVTATFRELLQHMGRERTPSREPARAIPAALAPAEPSRRDRSIP